MIISCLLLEPSRHGALSLWHRLRKVVWPKSNELINPFTTWSSELCCTMLPLPLPCLMQKDGSINGAGINKLTDTTDAQGCFCIYPSCSAPTWHTPLTTRLLMPCKYCTGWFRWYATDIRSHFNPHINFTYERDLRLKSIQPFFTIFNHHHDEVDKS